jgi:hypothetical protein
LNRSLIQHPGIFGWVKETNFCKLTTPPEGWKEGQWVLQKNPQYAPAISKIIQECPPSQVIVLARNPYAICRSLLEPLFARTRFGGTIEKACGHILAYYGPLLAQEKATPTLFFRARYEDFLKNPRDRLTELLKEVFALPFDENCLIWVKKAVPLGLGDPKASDTTGWNVDRAETWRVGQSRGQKDYVRTSCQGIFRALNYDPNDS